jgi:3'-5' exoribonuclease
MGKTFIADCKEGQGLTDFFLVRSRELRRRRNGEPFLSLVLGDRTGELPAVMWEGFEEVAATLHEGDLVKIQAAVGTFQGGRQLQLQRIRLATAEDGVNPEDFLPRSPRDPAESLDALVAATRGLADPYLRAMLDDLWADAAFVQAFLEAPAAKALHHAYLGGLAEHTASVVALCGRIAEHYPGVDRDLLVASAILHDVGKLQELRWRGTFQYTDAGRLLGHILQGVLFVEERLRKFPEFPPARRDQLLHNILAHHGELEWGSPVTPKTLEGLILHHVENLDGKVNQFYAFAREHPDPDRPGWTTYIRALERHLYVGGAAGAEAAAPATPPRREAPGIDTDP